MISTLDAVIESLVDSQSSTTATMRQKHVLRESLRALARLAQAEQMRDMRASVRRLTGVATDDTLPAMPGQDRTAQDGGPLALGVAGTCPSARFCQSRKQG